MAEQHGSWPGQYVLNPLTLKLQQSSQFQPQPQEQDTAAAVPLHLVPMRGSSCLPKGPLVCQVSGCGKDLTTEKGYYQRYRACKQHLGTMCLIVDGKMSRFCQQCGKFQELHEFDDNKRSCRARLAQHNARRRKRSPPRGSSSSSSKGPVSGISRLHAASSAPVQELAGLSEQLTHAAGTPSHSAEEGDTDAMAVATNSGNAGAAGATSITHANALDRAQSLPVLPVQPALPPHAPSLLQPQVQQAEQLPPFHPMAVPAVTASATAAPARGGGLQMGECFPDLMDIDGLVTSNLPELSGGTGVNGGDEGEDVAALLLHQTWHSEAADLYDPANTGADQLLGMDLLPPNSPSKPAMVGGSAALATTVLHMSSKADASIMPGVFGADVGAGSAAVGLHTSTGSNNSTMLGMTRLAPVAASTPEQHMAAMHLGAWPNSEPVLAAQLHAGFGMQDLHVSGDNPLWSSTSTLHSSTRSTVTGTRLVSTEMLMSSQASFDGSTQDVPRHAEIKREQDGRLLQQLQQQLLRSQQQPPQHTPQQQQQLLLPQANLIGQQQLQAQQQQLLLAQQQQPAGQHVVLGNKQQQAGLQRQQQPAQEQQQQQQHLQMLQQQQHQLLQAQQQLPLPLLPQSTFTPQQQLQQMLLLQQHQQQLLVAQMLLQQQQHQAAGSTRKQQGPGHKSSTRKPASSPSLNLPFLPSLPLPGPDASMLTGLWPQPAAMGMGSLSTGLAATAGMADMSLVNAAAMQGVPSAVDVGTAQGDSKLRPEATGSHNCDCQPSLSVIAASHATKDQKSAAPDNAQAAATNDEQMGNLLAMVQQKQKQQGLTAYQTVESLVRVSMKIANCVPDQLPPDLLQRLNSVLDGSGSSVLQGSVRAGCTHVILDVNVPDGCMQQSRLPTNAGNSTDRMDAARALIQQDDLQNILGNVMQFCRQAVLIQQDEWITAQSGSSADTQAIKSRAMEAASNALQAVLPVCVLRAAPRSTLQASGGDAEHRGSFAIYQPAELLVLGYKLDQPGLKLWVRMQGGSYAVRNVQKLQPSSVHRTVQPECDVGWQESVLSMLWSAAAKQGSNMSVWKLCVDMPFGLAADASAVGPAGALCMLEAEVDGMLGKWHPLLLLRGSHAASSRIQMELSQLWLKALGTQEVRSVRALVTDLGRIADFEIWSLSCYSGCRTRVAATSDASNSISLQQKLKRSVMRAVQSASRYCQSQNDLVHTGACLAQTAAHLGLNTPATALTSLLEASAAIVAAPAHAEAVETALEPAACYMPAGHSADQQSSNSDTAASLDGLLSSKISHQLASSVLLGSIKCLLHCKTMPQAGTHGFQGDTQDLDTLDYMTCPMLGSFQARMGNRNSKQHQLSQHLLLGAVRSSSLALVACPAGG